MDNETEKVTILKFSDDGGTTIDDVVARELPLTIMFNNKILITITFHMTYSGPAPHKIINN